MRLQALLQICFIPALIFLAKISTAKSWTARSYQVADGLPANNTSALIRDRRGFLWIGSENGIARFDGDRFQIYTTAQGLPDNEISALSLDERGQVVAWTYHNRPAAFDELRNRFGALPDTKLPAAPKVFQFGAARFHIDSFRLYKVTATHMQSRALPFSPARLSFTGRQLSLVSENGIAAALIDTASLQTVSLPLNGALAKEMLEDHSGNIWITTAGQGLLKLSRLPAISYGALLPVNMAPAVVAASGGLVACGDDKGRIAVFRHGCLESLVDISRWSRAISRIRAILPLPDGWYIAVEGDASLRLDKSFQIVSVYNRPWLNYTDRCAALWQDSIVLAGGHDRLVRLNLHSCQAADTLPLRSTALTVDRKGRLLIGTANGLYRQDDTGLFRFAGQVPELNARVSDLWQGPEGLLWVGLSTARLVVVDGERLVESIPLNRSLPGTGVSSLCSGRPGELWIGTDKGLSRMRYRYSAGTLTRSTTSFGTMDGLPGQINDLAWQADTVYVAGSSGFYALPDHVAPAVPDIPVFITGISINDRDTLLQETWSVSHRLNDWTIHFAGIDLSGADPVFQYRINSDPWQDAEGASLRLKELAAGAYQIRIRALRRDGQPSPGEASLRIRIAAPFWHELWFWALAFVLLLGVAMLCIQLIFRGRRARQLQRLQTEHALATSQQQTFSALMNPHFIFNALNSIQHYVLAQDKRLANRYLSGFGRLIRLNFESAQQSFISLEEELARLRLYLELEQMRFGEKLSWEIVLDEDLHPDEVRIPAMILQPFLENALVHGIAPAKIQGRLLLQVSASSGRILISIRDNGIGLANSKRLREGTGHRSRGMDLIRRRLELLQQLYGGRIELHFKDADPTDSQHPGTIVALVIPQFPA